MTHKPDYDLAAFLAAETLLKFKISFAPVLALPILKQMPGVLVLSFTEMASSLGLDRRETVTMFGAENQDAVTTVEEQPDGRLHYIVAYNQRLPLYICHRALARELGHIVLQHVGKKPEDVRTEEALAFARHLLAPRPLIKAIQDSGVRLTVETFGNITGCYGKCIAGMSQTPGAHVPANMNRQIKEQFSDYISNFLAYQTIIQADDDSPVADFGTYMDNYEE